MNQQYIQPDVVLSQQWTKVSHQNLACK